MRVLFVWPITRISVWDLARGYRRALGRLLPENSIRDFRLDLEAEYHSKALGQSSPDFKCLEKSSQFKASTELSLRASQPIINNAIYFNATHVIMVAAFGIHPAVLWTLEKLGIQATVLLTESPYDDVNQSDWVSIYPGMKVFTNERISAQAFNWDYLPHSYDPEVHQPVTTDFRCDVLMVGTGWDTRQKLLEEVDWTGIDLKLYGYWEPAKKGPLAPYVKGGITSNDAAAGMYSGAKIVLNAHRYHPTAESINPRVYEVAACGAFQLSDHRDELIEVFDSSVPVFDGPKQLSDSIRYYLKNDVIRSQLANQARVCVHDCTFDNRARQLLAEIAA